MWVPSEVRCIVCPLAFCCANCRRAHERTAHLLRYECPICRREKFLCSEDNLRNEHLLRHLAEEHLPLHCGKCEKIFSTMADLESVGKCFTIGEESENETTTNIINEEKEIEDRFNSIYERIFVGREGREGEENFEAIVSINKTKKTATITPVLQKKPLEESSLGSSEENEDIVNSIRTPYPRKNVPKTPRFKRTATPHIKKFLMRQLAQEINNDEYYDGSDESKSETFDEVLKKEPAKDDEEISGVQALQDTDNTRTPSRVLDNEYYDGSDESKSETFDEVLKKEPAKDDEEISGVQALQDTDNTRTPSDQTPQDEIHTPTSHALKVDKCAALASAVTTSTPTHPAGQWALFSEPGADSPLSEIEGTSENATASRQCSLNESSKAEMDSNPSKMAPKKLKSIIVIGARPRLEGQDSSEKQVTFADSACSEDCSSSSKTKKVKFAEDTKFDNAKPARVFRRPKRLLTPGPQKMRKYSNPRFQALLNQFESQGKTVARTPVYKRVDQLHATDLTPALSELATNIPARAINFKDDSPSSENLENMLAIDSPANELFKSCIESPDIPSNGNFNTAIAAFTTNIAGSIHTCLTTALQTSDEATEIQFKFSITKKKVSVRRIIDDGKVVNDKSSEFERHSNEKEGDNIWTAITKAVKSVFRSKQGDKENLPSTTPLTFARAKGSLESRCSASKRKFEDLSDPDMSPLNHKRYKYAGRIRGRRPLPRMLGVSGLKMSHSAEQQTLISQVTSSLREEHLNQSF